MEACALITGYWATLVEGSSIAFKKTLISVDEELGCWGNETRCTFWPSLKPSKALPKHILIKDLPEEDRFSRLRAEKRHFIHTIKLIACRAETAMAQIARETMARLDDARALMRANSIAQRLI
jgi:hypothetical protein